ncbi:hypothetical protein CspeluHIS016_0902630 [Cutaneotrichosporon spelunceum]|uniref:Uncharacterized protein n=1 Tax=Cutaneotrichosporon spelunceum TaxID=1672016 RepID=A0AAD3U0H3_9TREE|nr:hypothetical protein CspeluHIS016_0902630 [Cutaneotrichosporon spelunceum]
MAHYLRLLPRPEMREFANLRTRNAMLEEEIARLRIQQDVCTDYEVGELRAYREATDNLTAANLSLHMKVDNLTIQIETLGGSDAIEQVAALRKALAEANQRAQQMDFDLMEKRRENASLRGELKICRQQVGKYFTRVGELTRVRPPVGTVFHDIDLNRAAEEENYQTRTKKVLRDSIIITKERAPPNLPNQLNRKPVQNSKLSRPSIATKKSSNILTEAAVCNAFAPVQDTLSNLEPRGSETLFHDDKENQYLDAMKPPAPPIHSGPVLSDVPARDPRLKAPSPPVRIVDSLDLPPLEGTDSMFDYISTSEESMGVRASIDNATSF